MLSEIENFAIKNNIEKISVGTQVNNIKAQNFYVKCGFMHMENNSVYHWWPKGSNK
jgi:dTDP-4-amino-4,6-dideoxy-D-galactose acyltransferase